MRPGTTRFGPYCFSGFPDWAPRSCGRLGRMLTAGLSCRGLCPSGRVGSRSDFEREWGGGYQRPGWFSRCLAFFFRILPKVGPSSAFSFRTPGPEAQKLFDQSFEATLRQFRLDLDTLRSGRDLQLSNSDPDTGKMSAATGEAEI